MNAMVESSQPTQRDQPRPDASPRAGRRYCLITPCRDEAQYARQTLESVVAQTELPALWVIVDDGSRDDTPKILAEYASRHPWIRVVTRTDRGDRKLGGGVIEAFDAGYATIKPDDYDYICKFDLDLELPQTYFARIMDHMQADPRLAAFSGKPYFHGAHGELVSEKCGDEHCVGMIKFYRTAAYQQMGGFVREIMWDGIDTHRCRLLGWKAGSLDDPQTRFTHLRPMGTSHKSWWRGRVRHGFGQYFMGTGPAYMLASAVYRMSRPPVIVGGLAMLWGYVKSALTRRARYGDPDFRRFVQQYQWACLTKGKRRATMLIEAAQAPRWRPPTRS